MKLRMCHWLSPNKIEAVRICPLATRARLHRQLFTPLSGFLTKRFFWLSVANAA